MRGALPHERYLIIRFEPLLLRVLRIRAVEMGARTQVNQRVGAKRLSRALPARCTAATRHASPTTWPCRRLFFPRATTFPVASSRTRGPPRRIDPRIATSTPPQLGTASCMVLAAAAHDLHRNRQNRSFSVGRPFRLILPLCCCQADAPRGRVRRDPLCGDAAVRIGLGVSRQHSSSSSD